MKVNMPIVITAPQNKHWLMFPEQIYQSIDKGKISLLVFLDLSKAYDSVNHYLLLNKLVQLNLDSTCFESYLHNRTHSVKIGKIMKQSPIYMEYLRDQYLVQSSLTFFSMTFLKLINYQKLPLVQGAVLVELCNHHLF